MQAQLATMQEQLDALKRQVHGKKSEKRAPSKLPAPAPARPEANARGDQGTSPRRA